MAVITSSDKLRLVQVLITTGILVTRIYADEINNHNSDKRFITLSADCSTVSKNSSIGVTLHTSEPFFGSLYSRDYPSSCKIL